jgi:hypothetical protein
MACLCIISDVNPCPGFLSNALANFLGSVLAALLIWLSVKWAYDLPKSRKDRQALLALSYALIKREIEAATGYCEEHLKATIDQMSASGPITQTWEALHSMEAFKVFPPEVSKHLVKYYSLLFRLQKNVDLERMLLFGEMLPQVGENLFRRLRERTADADKQVCREVLDLTPKLQSVLNREIARLRGREKRLFLEAYEPKAP